MFSSTFYGHSEGAQGGGGRVVVVRMDSPEAVMFELGCEDVSTEPWGTCCGGSLFSATSSPGSPNGASVPRDCQEPSRRPSPAAMTHSGHSEVGDPERNFPPPPTWHFPTGEESSHGVFPFHMVKDDASIPGRRFLCSFPSLDWLPPASHTTSPLLPTWTGSPLCPRGALRPSHDPGFTSPWALATLPL